MGKDCGGKAVWFREGLPFTCQGCGDCCRGPGGVVWLNEQEMTAMAARLGLPLEGFTRRYVRLIGGDYALVDNIKGDCVFLGEDGRCAVYEERPTQCRTFPWWPEIVESRDSWENCHYDCPGINKGKVHSVREILARLGEKS